MELFFDTETTGLVEFKKPHSDPSQPHMVQLGAILAESMDIIHSSVNMIVKPENNWFFNPKAVETHGISPTLAKRVGIGEDIVSLMFLDMLRQADTLVCHNVAFDLKVMKAAFVRYGVSMQEILAVPTFCTMIEGTTICKLPGRYGKYKWPKLQELHKHLFGVEFEGAHDAFDDIRATMRCYYSMKQLEKGN